MGAFFSGTDDANENMTQFYGVWGKVTDALPMWAFRYVVGKSKVQCDPSILIDWPTAKVQETIIRSSSMVLSGETDVLDLEITGSAIEQTSSPVTTQKEERVIAGPFKMLPYPTDWMAQHSKPKYPAYTPSPYYGGGKNYGGRPTGSQVDTYGQTSLTDFYDEEYHWKTGKQVGGAGQKKWESAAASGARNSYEPQLLALDDFEERVSECVEVSTEKGAPSKELASFGEKVAQKLVVDGNSIGYFYK